MSPHLSPEVVEKVVEEEEEVIASTFQRKSHTGFCSPAHISTYVVFVTATSGEIRSMRRGLLITESLSGDGAAQGVQESVPMASDPVASERNHLQPRREWGEAGCSQESGLYDMADVTID